MRRASASRAIQVGVPKRILVIDLQEPEEEGWRVRQGSARLYQPRKILRNLGSGRAVTRRAAYRCPTSMLKSICPDRIRARWLDLGGNVP